MKIWQLLSHILFDHIGPILLMILLLHVAISNWKTPISVVALALLWVIFGIMLEKSKEREND